MQARETVSTTFYEALQVHPAAPLELIAAAYWRLAGQAQTRRAVSRDAEAELHQLTRAYQTLTINQFREEYDRSIGVGVQSPAPEIGHGRDKKPRRSRGEIRPDADVDYYEILRVVPGAQAAIVAEAYSTLKPYYTRLVNNDYASPYLLEYLEQARFVIGDPERRLAYDEARKKRGRDGSARRTDAGTPDDAASPSVGKNQAKPVSVKRDVGSAHFSGRSSALGSVSAAATGAIGAIGAIARLPSSRGVSEKTQRSGWLHTPRHVKTHGKTQGPPTRLSLLVCRPPCIGRARRLRVVTRLPASPWKRAREAVIPFRSGACQ